MIEVHPSELPSAFGCPQSIRPTSPSIDSDMAMANVGTAVHACLASRANGIDPDFAAAARSAGIGDVHEIESLYDTGVPWLDNLIAAGNLGNMHTRVETPLKMEIERHGLEIRLLGTADLLQLDQAEHRAFVIDWKSGWKDKDFWWQMAAYALLTFEACPWCEKVTAMIGWLRTGEMESFTFTREQHYDMIRDGIASMLRSDGYVTGSQCLTCQRRHDCEARNDVVRTQVSALATINAGDVSKKLTDLTPDERGNLYHRLRIAEQALGSIKAGIRSLVESGESVRVAKDRELELKTTNRKEVKPRESWEYLCDMFGEGIADVTKISKGQLDKAIKNKAKLEGRVQRELLAEVYRDLRHLKAIEDHETKVLSERRVAIEDKTQETTDGRDDSCKVRTESTSQISGNAQGTA